MLDRDHNRGVPEDEAPFIANEVLCTGNFVKVALNVARRAAP
jgi:hypothetical protein